jgi:hypothetical protein
MENIVEKDPTTIQELSYNIVNLMTLSSLADC